MTPATYAVVAVLTVIAAAVALIAAWHANRPRRPPVTDLRARQLHAEDERHGVHDPRPST